MQKAHTIVYLGTLQTAKNCIKRCKGKMHDASGMIREDTAKITNLIAPCSLAAQQTLRIHFLGCKNNAEKTRTVTNQAARFFFGLMLAFLYPWLNSLSYSFENSYCCGSMASPMIMIAVLVIFAFFTFDAIVCKVPKIIF